MARYWIRNRGRVQGPFSEERIQGLLRRGRFNRHFHVSEDRRNWYPAAEFPELFEGVGAPAPAADDDGPLPTGGSPFDDEQHDDAPPAQIATADRRRRKSRRRPVDDEDYEDDEEELDDDQDDDGFDDDEEEWEDDEEFDGLIPAAVNWVERHVVPLLVVLVLILGGLSWFLFLREDFTQDIADMEQLMAVQSRIMQAHQRGTPANEWIGILEETEQELSPMITRLDDQASAQDMVKQELLFLARDDIPRMIKELPKGQHDAATRVRIRLGLVDDMIKQQIRWHDGTALMVQPAAPAAPQAPHGESNPQNAPTESPAASGDNPSTPQATPGNGSAPPASPPPGANPVNLFPQPDLSEIADRLQTAG